jgi:integrase
VYFGVWSDPEAALADYQRQEDDLHAGRAPRLDPAQTTIKDLVNRFLTQKQTLVDAGQMTTCTWSDYKAVCDLVVAQFGKVRLAEDVGPEDFAALWKKVAKRWGPHRLGSKLVQYTRSLFKYALDAGLIARATRFGPGFARPTKRVLRLNRAEQGPKLFTAEEIRRLIEAAGPHLKAMLMLGIGCAFGNADCGTLPISAVDFDNAIIDFPRPKTGICRRCPLWPETVEALKESLACRPEAKDPAGVAVAPCRWTPAEATEHMEQRHEPFSEHDPRHHRRPR